MKISGKKLSLLLALVLISAPLFAVSFVYHYLLFVSIPALAGTLYFMSRVCRCPHCGTRENMDRLMYARNHVFHCRGCGAIIEIDKA